MSLENQMEEMKARIFSGGLSFSDKKFIEANYERVLFRTFRKTSCGQCYKDAFIEMYTHLKKYGLKEMGKFILKRGVVLQTAGDATVYTNANLTDEVAVAYLKENPNRLNLFADYPQNWDTLPEEPKKETSKTARKKTTKKKADTDEKKK